MTNTALEAIASSSCKHYAATSRQIRFNEIFVRTVRRLLPLTYFVQITTLPSVYFVVFYHCLFAQVRKDVYRRQLSHGLLRSSHWNARRCSHAVWPWRRRKELQLLIPKREASASLMLTTKQNKRELKACCSLSLWQDMDAGNGVINAFHCQYTGIIYPFAVADAEYLCNGPGSRE